MLKIYLLDCDEDHMRRMKDIFGYMPETQVVGCSSNPKIALIEVEALKPDAVFLDIELEGISGLDMSDVIRAKCAAEIVFVTASRHYALHAFEKQAVDYILKPLTADRLLRTIGLLDKRSSMPESRLL